MSLKLGIVVATYPEGNSIDVLLARDGSRLSNVQVTSAACSQATGLCNLPDIGASAGLARWDPTQPAALYVQAVIDDVGGVPICTGFILPQVGQMTFARKNFKVDRHASDVYSTINAAGDMETYHPSGSYVRMGAATPHEDLTGLDVDKQWVIEHNTGTAVHYHIVLANAGVVKAVVDIDPSGNVTLTNSGNLTTTTSGNAQVNVSGSTTVNSTGNLTAIVGGTTSVNSSGDAEITAPHITLNGITTINGATLINGPLSQGTGGAGGGATMAGPLTVTADVTAGGKSLDSHTHGGVQNGSGNTSGPN
jgi:hypothetical protein